MRLPSMTFVLAMPLLAMAQQPRPITLPGEKVYPESLTSLRDGTLLVGSLGQQRIFKIVPGQMTPQPWIAPGTGGMTRSSVSLPTSCQDCCGSARTA